MMVDLVTPMCTTSQNSGHSKHFLDQLFVRKTVEKELVYLSTAQPNKLPSMVDHHATQEVVFHTTTQQENELGSWGTEDAYTAAHHGCLFLFHYYMHKWNQIPWWKIGKRLLPCFVEAILINGLQPALSQWHIHYNSTSADEDHDQKLHNQMKFVVMLFCQLDVLLWSGELLLLLLAFLRIYREEHRHTNTHLVIGVSFLLTNSTNGRLCWSYNRPQQYLHLPLLSSAATRKLVLFELQTRALHCIYLSLFLPSCLKYLMK